VTQLRDAAITYTVQTTLAHIVAKHCGYTPVEVNASDDRSPEKLKELIHNATQNATLLAQARPNCVILDEIDGIDGSRNALDVLTAIVKAPLKAGATTSGGKTGKSATFPLTRPLICICNDQYAPALRDLIKLADVFVFSGKQRELESILRRVVAISVKHLVISLSLDSNMITIKGCIQHPTCELSFAIAYSNHMHLLCVCAAPQDVRLVQRLRQVCKQEGLHVGNSAFIAELCSATGGDIRSSINNLQFAALKTKSLQQDGQRGAAAGVAKAAASNWGPAFGRSNSTKPAGKPLCWWDG
jgi:DNA polymerase III delta prime subunit